MKYIEYNSGPDFGTDYAPDSYLNIGAVQLMETCETDANIMMALTVDTVPQHGGFDFDTYRADCENAPTRAARRNAWVLEEAAK